MRNFILSIIAFFILSATCAADQWPVLTKSQSGGHWPNIKKIECPGGICNINKIAEVEKISYRERKVNFNRRVWFPRVRGVFR